MTVLLGKPIGSLVEQEHGELRRNKHVDAWKLGAIHSVRRLIGYSRGLWVFRMPMKAACGDYDNKAGDRYVYRCIAPEHTQEEREELLGVLELLRAAGELVENNVEIDE